MDTNEQLIEVFDARVKRREERRDFFKTALGGTLAIAGAGGFFYSNAASAQTVTDADVLNFALNLEYLEAQFYSYAAKGVGLAANLQTGTGTQGGLAAPAGSTPARKVVFADPLVSAYAQEIANDEIAHVTFLRTALGTSTAVAQPQLNISGGSGSAFAAAATAAGIPGGSTFDPYTTDENFLLGAFIFEDVGVTAYKGASPLISNKTFLEAAAGILAVEAYHAGLVRTVLYAKGMATPALRSYADGISNARDSLDGTTTTQVPEDAVTGKSSDDDQGISSTTTSFGSGSNIVPTNTNGLAYSRTTGQVLNIVYLNPASVMLGGFFPAGVNGNIKSSANNA